MHPIDKDATPDALVDSLYTQAMFFDFQRALKDVHQALYTPLAYTVAEHLRIELTQSPLAKRRGVLMRRKG